MKSMVVPRAVKVFIIVLLLGFTAGRLHAEQTFSFNNLNEPATLDPAFMTGVPERNLFLALFEGLTTLNPKTLAPEPGVAKTWKISEQGKKYLFYLNEKALWSNGQRVVAEDFVFSWQRMLTSKNKTPLAYLLFPIVNARGFHEGTVADFSKVGVRALDKATLEVRLDYPAPYFLFLTALYAMAPVHAGTIKKFGDKWTNVKHLVSNGPFKIKQWLPHERLVVEKFKQYWDAANVRLDKIVFLPISDKKRALQLYESGVIQWTGNAYLPTEKMAILKRRPDYYEPRSLTTYFLRLNVTWPALKNLEVRRALHLAIDKELLVKRATKSGEIAAQSFVPNIISGYKPAEMPGFNPVKAAHHWQKAGFCLPGNKIAGCKTFPKIVIMSNKDGRHENVLSEILQMWNQHLGINAIVVEKKWKDYLQHQRALKYAISRSGWVADFPDPLSFLGLFRSDSGGNATGWANKKFDGFLNAALREVSPIRRAGVLQNAEAELLREVPIVPLFHYTYPYLLNSAVHGFYGNSLDVHPFKKIFLSATAGASK